MSFYTTPKRHLSVYANVSALEAVPWNCRDRVYPLLGLSPPAPETEKAHGPYLLHRGKRSPRARRADRKSPRRTARGDDQCLKTASAFAVAGRHLARLRQCGAVSDRARWA